MKCTSDDGLVFFTSSRKGTVVRPSDFIGWVGYVSDSWFTNYFVDIKEGEKI
jgi:hypothetical protein